MSDMSVNVHVTVWWEDVGGRDEREFVIPLAREARCALLDEIVPSI